MCEQAGIIFLMINSLPDLKGREIEPSSRTSVGGIIIKLSVKLRVVDFAVESAELHK